MSEADRSFKPCACPTSERYNQRFSRHRKQLHCDMVGTCKLKFLIVGTGRSGSSLLSAIICQSGGSFGLPAVEDWDRSRGTLEHPYIHSAYKWYSRATRIRESLIPDQAATVCLSICRSHLKKNLHVANYIKSTQLVWLVNEINRLEPVGVIGIYRKFSSYLASRYLKFGGDYAKWRGVWTNVNATVLLQASTYPSALVSYEELIDPNESDWATRLHELIGIPVQAILTARKELAKTASVTRETFEDEETKRLYASLRNFQRATTS